MFRFPFSAIYPSIRVKTSALESVKRYITDTEIECEIWLHKISQFSFLYGTHVARRQDKSMLLDYWSLNFTFYIILRMLLRIDLNSYPI